MSKPLKLLLIEDSERDAALLKLYLRRGGYDVDLHRVETQEDLRGKLDEGGWDVIVSDFNLPQFNALAAIRSAQEHGSGVPFIVVSGEVSPAVVESIVATGSSYLSKFEMASIVSVIEASMQARS